MRSAVYDIARFLSMGAPVAMLLVFVLALAGGLSPLWVTVDLVVLLLMSAIGTGISLWLRPR